MPGQGAEALSRASAASVSAVDERWHSIASMIDTRSGMAVASRAAQPAELCMGPAMIDRPSNQTTKLQATTPTVLPPMPLPVYLVPAVLLLVAAFASLPYGYYQFLRIAVCGAAGLCAFHSWQARGAWMSTALGLVAILYNPVFRIHLERSDWQIINLATISIFLLAWFIAKRRWVHSL